MDQGPLGRLDDVDHPVARYDRMRLKETRMRWALIRRDGRTRTNPNPLGRLSMPRRPLAHVGAELSGRITAIDSARAQLFDIDVDRKKRIDDAIDYFGAGHIDVAREGVRQLQSTRSLPRFRTSPGPLRSSLTPRASRLQRREGVRASDLSPLSNKSSLRPTQPSLSNSDQTSEPDSTIVTQGRDVPRKPRK